MHTPEYHKDRIALNVLDGIALRIRALEEAINQIGEGTLPANHELQLTRMLEELDGVDTTGRSALRQVRKRLIERVQMASRESS
mmetsp:Transcript_32615/g.44126  ORF Transcript_32615/g.44126 Transcript_32615/m.44126 type:complete len:84 (+) Transcript_32615:824-1075(+)